MESYDTSFAKARKRLIERPLYASLGEIINAHLPGHGEAQREILYERQRALNRVDYAALFRCARLVIAYGRELQAARVPESTRKMWADHCAVIAKHVEELSKEMGETP